ncbi:MAG: hypothetical protein D3924_09190 [Candidatus Electrothrix sp. AR4]|nr:hypothetical protein [Candidatus Electrothrix sp. AR4]
MKKLFIAAAITVLLPFSTVLHAADEQKEVPKNIQEVIEKDFRNFDKKIEDEANKELEEFLANDGIKKTIEAQEEKRRLKEKGSSEPRNNN